MNDTEWMQQAMNEAAKGGWSVHPNPMVGAIIVKDGVELGRGYHHGAGKPHAEVEALHHAEQLGHDVHGASIYVTLEPCNHYGKTPPCTEALISAGIKRCFIGTVDSDKRVRGAGIRRLTEAGIECHVGYCEQELGQLNAAFFTRTSENRPYITAKWAMTADGRTASRTGSSQWITGKEARQDVHAERAIHDAIMAGTQTVLLDNPQLNVRLDGSYRQPVRIILDRHLIIPRHFHIFDTQDQSTILFTSTKDADLSAYTDLGVTVEIVEENETHTGLDIMQILSCLAEKYTFTTLYCEGGATLHGALNDLGVIDQIHLYMAPKIIGGEQARCCIGGLGKEQMSDAQAYTFETIKRLGNDVRMVMHRIPKDIRC